MGTNCEPSLILIRNEGNIIKYCAQAHDNYRGREMAKHDKEAIERVGSEVKEETKKAQAAAREFWANQRLNQTDQPKPTPQRSVKM